MLSYVSKEKECRLLWRIEISPWPRQELPSLAQISETVWWEGWHYLQPRTSHSESRSLHSRVADTFCSPFQVFLHCHPPSINVWRYLCSISFTFWVPQGKPYLYFCNSSSPEKGPARRNSYCSQQSRSLFALKFIHRGNVNELLQG